VAASRPKNLAASVSQRLRNLARADGTDYQRILERYAGERLLYRLQHVPNGDRFILKGAALWVVWEGTQRRPTRDVDLLGPGRGTTDAMTEAFRVVCTADVMADGLSFDPATVTAAVIREDEDYEGVRVTMVAQLGRASIPVQVDIGFGDAVTPAPLQGTVPPLLDFPAVHMRVYPVETVVAEKFETMVKRGLANTRMKDFYDLLILSATRTFDLAALRLAITRTFDNRGTPLSATELPVALTPVYAGGKGSQWLSFLDKNELSDVPRDLEVVVDGLRVFLDPVATKDGHARIVGGVWRPGRGWND
jgi:nucleotidyltransferase AbiEii toxin of type IV toxin-antitoxin system